MIIKYAIINPNDNTVSKVKYYDNVNSDWTTFKSSYETENPTLKLIDITTSDFPSGQDWSQDFDNDGNIYIEPKDELSKSLNTIKTKIINILNQKTYGLKFSDTYTCNSHTYDKSDNMQHKYALYLSMANNESLYPVEIPQLDTGLYLTINNKTELESFVNPLLQSSFQINRDASLLLNTVNGYANIEDCIKFVDSR